MAGANLLALIDDISTVLDDVAVLSKVAAKKTAGVLGDDLALNAQQEAGVTADRELPVVWAVFKGSAINKLILVPAALAISAFIPWAVVPLLMVGGAFLCFEGFEKLAHKCLHQFLVVVLVLRRAVQELVGQLLETLEAQVGTADHQQRDDGPGGQCADGERRRHQDRLVEQGTQGDGPDHRQFAVGIDAGHLLGVERQVVAQHAGRLLGRHLAHDGHVIEDGRDIVDQCQQTACHLPCS